MQVGLSAHAFGLAPAITPTGPAQPQTGGSSTCLGDGAIGVAAATAENEAGGGGGGGVRGGVGVGGGGGGTDWDSDGQQGGLYS